MRRGEKEITDRAEIDRIIRESQVCRLGLSDDGTPYVIPLNFGYDGTAIYLHSALQGRKLEILRQNNRVCLEFDIPEGLVRGEQPCNWGMRYRSVIAFGIAREVSDPEERRRGLSCIMAQYAGYGTAGEGQYSFPDAMVERTAVILVEIREISGKRSPATE